MRYCTSITSVGSGEPALVSVGKNRSCTQVIIQLHGKYGIWYNRCPSLRQSRNVRVAGLVGNMVLPKNFFSREGVGAGSVAMVFNVSEAEPSVRIEGIPINPGEVPSSNRPLFRGWKFQSDVITPEYVSYQLAS